MANEEVDVDKKTVKAAEKARRKEAKKKAKAAGENDDYDTEEGGIGGKIAVFFVSVIIFLIWIAIIVLLIKWDVGGFGSSVLTPVLKDVPYVNQILPKEDVSEFSTEESAYAYTSLNDAIEQIKKLETELAEAQNASLANKDRMAELEAQATELQRYKQGEAQFEKEKERFYEEVVFSSDAPSIAEYQSFYESIDPANAEIIYRQVVEQTTADKKIEEYVKTYSSMKPKEAAAIFDSMTGNLKLVANILEHMDAKPRADILGKMDTETAAKVTEILKPSE